MTFHKKLYYFVGLIFMIIFLVYQPIYMQVHPIEVLAKRRIAFYKRYEDLWAHKGCPYGQIYRKTEVFIGFLYLYLIYINWIRVCGPAENAARETNSMLLRSRTSIYGWEKLIVVYRFMPELRSVQLKEVQGQPIATKTYKKSQRSWTLLIKAL